MTIAVSVGMVISLFIFTTIVDLRVTGTIEKNVNRLGGDVMIVPAGALTAARQFLIESKRSTFYMDRAILEKIISLEYMDKMIDKITSHLYLATLSGICCGVSEAQIVAFNPKEDFVVSAWLKKATGKELKKDEAFVGSVADAEWQLLEIGDVATILGKGFKIAGVLEATGTSFDNTVFLREEDVIDAIERGTVSKNMRISPDRISVIFVKLKEGQDPESFVSLIEEKFPEVDAVPRGEVGRGLKNTLAGLNKVFSTIIFFTTFLSVMMVNAFFSAIVNERMREAGIIMALGAKKVHIFGIFISEAIMIGIAGSVIGIAIGNIMGYFFSGGVSIVHGSLIKLALPAYFKIISISFIGGLVVCATGALFPIIRISKMEPLDAIQKGG